mgnify:CR=1 FL=1
MANLALQSASTGLSALNTRLDVVANNLANINTPGFKASRANFQDLMYIERAQPGVENAIGDSRPTGLYVGLGVKVSGTQFDFNEGPVLATDRPLDVRIDGSGFFQVEIEDGVIGYTRSGNFALNSDGELVLANDQGRRLDPGVSIPPDATEVDIGIDGQVFVKLPGDAVATPVGQLQLATFVNPAGLEPIGENLFTETAGSGPPTVGNPSEENRGRLRQGMLEGSNVDPTRELIDLIRTQRAFEMNSQAIRVADETLSAVSQLRR